MRAKTGLVSTPDRAISVALSELRAYDSALEIRGAYKLTGNFHVNLEILLEYIGASDEVTFQVSPRSWLIGCPDCRAVEFRPKGNVQKERLSEIMRTIKGRIGFVSKQPWWARLRHRRDGVSSALGRL